MNTWSQLAALATTAKKKKHFKEGEGKERKKNHP